MPKTGKIVKRNRTTETGKLTGWAMALERAENALTRNRVHAARLRIAIRLFSQKLSNREPWPEDEANIGLSVTP